MRTLPTAARAALAAVVGAAAFAAAEGFWVEPYGLLLADRVGLAPGPAPLRIVHLSDLHVARETRRERRLLRALAGERPDLIAVSGDLVADSHDPDRLARQTRAAAALVAELRRLAPVAAVQGHSEYLGPLVAALADAGVDWLSNEGRLYGAPPAVLLLGLNQQVGRDRLVPGERERLGPLRVGGEPAWGKRGGAGEDHLYLHYDPAPAGLGDLEGALAWEAYEVEGEVRLADRRSEAGLVVLSHYPAGLDRMVVLRRSPPGEGTSTRFTLAPHGTSFDAGEVDTGVDPEPGRWYRLRVRVRAGDDATRVEARAWPAGEPEPSAWQAAAEDRSRHRLTAGTVGIWARSGGVAYRRLRVVGAGGELRLDAPLSGSTLPRGFRRGARGSRLALALARSPGSAGAPRIVLSHVPDPVLEAAYRGLEAVLAGHTHGGQVRLPGGVALATRSALGPHFHRGVFDFAAPNRRGWTRLYLNSGVGTSFLPVRLFCPPRYAVVEVGPAVR